MSNQRFTFENDPDHGDVLVSVEGMVMDDADGVARLLNPRTPLSSLPDASRRVCAAALLAMAAIAEPEGVVKVSFTEEDKASSAAAEDATAAELAALGEGTGEVPNSTKLEYEGESTSTSSQEPVSAPNDAEVGETVTPTKEELHAALDALNVKYDARAGVPRLQAMLAEAQGKTAE